MIWPCRSFGGTIAAMLLSGSLGCSIPSLEDPKCADAQDSVRRFYSLHFDRLNADPKSKASNTEGGFFSDRLAGELAQNAEVDNNYFTATANQPKAFRVGTCKLIDDRKADVSVLLLWRNDDKSEQREIRVQTINANGSWLIDTVSVK